MESESYFSIGPHTSNGFEEQRQAVLVDQQSLSNIRTPDRPMTPGIVKSSSYAQEYMEHPSDLTNNNTHQKNVNESATSDTFISSGQVSLSDSVTIREMADEIRNEKQRTSLLMKVSRNEIDFVSRWEDTIEESTPEPIFLDSLIGDVVRNEETIESSGFRKDSVEFYHSLPATSSVEYGHNLAINVYSLLAHSSIATDEIMVSSVLNDIYNHNSIWQDFDEGSSGEDTLDDNIDSTIDCTTARNRDGRPITFQFSIGDDPDSPKDVEEFGNEDGEGLMHFVVREEDEYVDSKDENFNFNYDESRDSEQSSSEELCYYVHDENEDAGVLTGNDVEDRIHEDGNISDYDHPDDIGGGNFENRDDINDYSSSNGLEKPLESEIVACENRGADTCSSYRKSCAADNLGEQNKEEDDIFP